MKYLVYDSTTGQIIGYGDCVPSDLSLQAHELNHVVMEHFELGPISLGTKKINLATFAIEDRPVMPSAINKTVIDANGSDACIISGLPNPTHVWIDDEGKWEVTDGSFEFTTDTIGEYKIRLFNSTHLEMEYTVNAG